MKKTDERHRTIVYPPSNFSFDTDFFACEIDELIKKLSVVKSKHKEFLKEFKKKNSKGYKPEWDLIDEYTFDFDFDYDDMIEIYLRFSRPETKEEQEKRLEVNKKRSEAAKQVAKNQKLAQEKRERTLLETLKKKYEQEGNV